MNPLGLTPPSRPCEFDDEGAKARASTPRGLTLTSDPSDLSEKDVEARASTPIGLDAAQLLV